MIAISPTAPADTIAAWYNFACAAARGGHSDEALDIFATPSTLGFGRATIPSRTTA